MVSGAVEGQFDGQSMCGIVAGSTEIYENAAAKWICESAEET